MNRKTGQRQAKMRLHEHDTSVALGDPALIFRTFVECLKEGDAEAAAEVLAGGLNHLNKSQMSRRYDIPRRTIYNLLARKSSPSLDLVAKACRAICQEAAARSKPRSAFI